MLTYNILLHPRDFIRIRIFQIIVLCFFSFCRRVVDEQQRQEQMMIMRGNGNNNNPDLGMNMNQRGGQSNQQVFRIFDFNLLMLY